MEDIQAIRRLQQGDISGLAWLVEHYQHRALRTAYLVLQDRAAAEDIVQAAFLRVFERIHQYDLQRPFAPWFLKIVINDALKLHARSASHTSLEHFADLPDTVFANPEAAAEQALCAEAIWAALADLSPGQRATIVERYYLDLSENEMAQLEGCATGTIKWRLSVARERLRSRLRDWYQPAHKTLGE